MSVLVSTTTYYVYAMIDVLTSALAVLACFCLCLSFFCILAAARSSFNFKSSAAGSNSDSDRDRGGGGEFGRVMSANVNELAADARSLRSLDSLTHQTHPLPLPAPPCTTKNLNRERE